MSRVPDVRSLDVTGCFAAPRPRCWSSGSSTSRSTVALQVHNALGVPVVEVVNKTVDVADFARVSMSLIPLNGFERRPLTSPSDLSADLCVRCHADSNGRADAGVYVSRLATALGARLR